MTKAIPDQIAELAALSTSELQGQWERAYLRPAPKRMSRDLLLRALAYHVQEQEEGGLTRSEQSELAALAAGKSPRTNGAIKPGTRLLRQWQGVTHEVIVLPEGYLWQERSHKSLSEIARAITGTRWSGPRFFGL